MAHIPHALGLPEVTFPVAQYLEFDDFIACSLVCKTFHAFYAPYIWETIHIGVFSLTDKRTKRIQEPQARLISFETDTADHSHQQGQLSREERFLQGIQEIAPWIRSLTIHSHHSPRQLRLGNQCTNISTLSIVAPPFNEQFGEDYWNECEALVLQNTTHLRSLTLIRWGKPCDNHQPTFPTPLWTPLITCAQHANLSELRIRDGTIRGQDSEAFWKICQQLEILELTKVNLEELLTPRDISSIGTSGGDDNRRGQVESILINKHATSAINALRPTTTRFPKLRKLTMANLDLHPPLQMEHFVLHCPMLQTLNLRLKRGSSFPMGNFCDHFAAQSWPYLDALEISGQANDITGQEHALILQSAKRPFKYLHLILGTVGELCYEKAVALRH
ncbi:hypothetical protein B0O80DRAFT_87250 [Mortierella sp. GBAus27b]|nr:hypothetical protein B0O80DRAFT_87250 [Mortierella sp. GBAus27b]